MGTPLTSGNRGVSALGAALTRLCLDGASSVNVSIFGSHSGPGTFTMRPHGRPVNLPVVHWRLSPRSHPRDHLLIIVAGAFFYRYLPLGFLRRRIASAIPWIRAVETTDFIGDVRGGDSFSDIYGLKRFLVATLPVLSVVWVKGCLVLFPQTYGPFKSRISRGIAKWVIRHSSVAIARDESSQAIAQEMARPGQQILLSADVAFALHADSMTTAELDGKMQPIPDGAIGLNVNGLMFNGGYTGKNMFGLKLTYRSFLPELATRLLAVHPGPLILVPHTYAPPGNVESDNESCQSLKQSLPPELQSRILLVTGEYDAHQLKGIIARCDFFVGARMHSCIAALSQGVPCVGIAYSMKFGGVFASVGMGEWVVDGRSMTNAEAVEAVLRLYSQRAEKSVELARDAEAARDGLRKIFGSLVGSWQAA